MQDKIHYFSEINCYLGVHNFRVNMVFNLEQISCRFRFWFPMMYRTESSFLTRSWNGDDSSLYVIFNACWCKELILLLRRLPWNIQAKGQFPNWDIINASITCLFWSHMYIAILAAVFGFFFFTEVFYVIFKESFESKAIPSSSLLALTMSFPENSF